MEKADFEVVSELEKQEQAEAAAAGFGKSAKSPSSSSSSSGASEPPSDADLVDKTAAALGELPSLTVKASSKVASVRRAPKQASTIAAYWNMGES